MLSPDGRFALSITPSLPEKLMLLPTGAGEAKTLSSGGIAIYDNAGWTPDGRHVVFEGIEPRHSLRIYLQDLDGGLPQPITEEGVAIGSQAVVDAQSVLGRGPDGAWSRYPLNGGKPEGVPALKPTDDPLRFDPTGVMLYVAEKNQLPIRISRWTSTMAGASCGRRLRRAIALEYKQVIHSRSRRTANATPIVPTSAVGPLSCRRPAVANNAEWITDFRRGLRFVSVDLSFRWARWTHAASANAAG